MSELMESIALPPEDPWNCPFSHDPEVHDRENYIPPPTTKNDATKLSKSLNGQSQHLDPINIKFKVKSGDHVHEHDHVAQFSAHHLIPGNEAWPKSDLYKWIDKSKGHVIGDIGYDVNNAKNGVDLPSHTTEKSWSLKTPMFQKAYAFSCMEADPAKRQFHDRHPAYSDFVVKVLNKVAAKLEVKEKPGCGKKNCSAGNQKPFAPPYELNIRLDGISTRLRKYLKGDESKWRKPLMTSRFALLYHNRVSNKEMTQDEARQELSVDNFL